LTDPIERESRHDSYGEDVESATRAAALRVALARYEDTGSPAMLDQAFGAAAAAVSVMRGARASEPADIAELRELVVALPEFGRLISAAVDQGERWAHSGAGELWAWFGLSSQAPAWNEAERSGARLLVAGACAPLDARGVEWLRLRLLRLAAERWATLLTEELRAGGEEVWRRAFGERYESLRGRYAPRTTWRTRELSRVLEQDENTIAAIRRRLARWLVDSRDFDRLGLELEAAFVETRTPARLA
jgi:hypothetical protein